MRKTLCIYAAHNLNDFDEGFLLGQVGLGEDDLEWHTMAFKERKEAEVACLEAPSSVDQEEDSLQVPARSTRGYGVPKYTTYISFHPIGRIADHHETALLLQLRIVLRVPRAVL